MTDFLLHMIGFAILTALFTRLFKDRKVALALVLLIGLLKEVYLDSYISMLDIAGNLVGMYLGSRGNDE